ncbi:hypothetical protein C1149_07370 [Clostridium botulinum]|nr:hypothetical protein C1149_07370 [Clostridium botulinum]
MNITNAEEIIDSLIDKNLFVIIIDEKEAYIDIIICLMSFKSYFSKINKDEQIKLHLKAYEAFKNKEILRKP